MEIVPFHISHIEALALLHQKLTPQPLPLIVKYLRWRFSENPFSTQPLLASVIDQGNIVATRYAYAQPFQIGQHSEPIIIACFGGTVVTKAYEGKWLLNKVTKKLFEMALDQKYQLGINLSPGPAVKLHSRRTAWQELKPWSCFHRPAFKGQHSSNIESPFESIDQLEQSPIKKNGKTLSQGAIRTNEIIALCKQTDTRFGINNWMSDSFIQWRLKNPYCDYRILYVHGDSLEGYAIIAKVKMENRIFLAQIKSTSKQIELMLINMISQRIQNLPIIISSKSIAEENQPILEAEGFKISRNSSTFNRPYLLTEFNQGSIDLKNLYGVNLLDSDSWSGEFINTELV